MEFIRHHKDLFALIGLGISVVLVTKYLLTMGVEWLADNARVGPKFKGKVLGFSTSVPELVATSSTAAMGLIGAGLWNIAASNIINFILFLSAMIWHRQQHRVLQRQFLDELGFALSAIGLPLLLVLSGGLERSPWTAVALLGVFGLYMVLDRLLNKHVHETYADEVEAVSGSHSVAGALLLIGLGILGITLSGYFLGQVAERVVNNQGVSQWAVGIILGVITSLPEMTTFFVVFAAARKSEQDTDSHMQASLDNLAASNMSNLGIIFPIGITVYVIATSM